MRAQTYQEGGRELPVREFDVVVAGGGTAGVVAALAAARQGAKTALIEPRATPAEPSSKAARPLHSFFNLWKAFPGVAETQVVKGIPQEIVDRLAKVGGTSGHAEMTLGYDYDSVCTAIDTELYKLVAYEMLAEAGVFVALNTLLAGADRARARGQGRDCGKPRRARGDAGRELRGLHRLRRPGGLRRGRDTPSRTTTPWSTAWAWAG